MEDRQITTNSNVRYIVVARETGDVLSYHFSFATAASALKRKQPHWYRRLYDKREKIQLYVYKLNIEGTEWRMLNDDGHDYEFTKYLESELDPPKDPESEYAPYIIP